MIGSAQKRILEITNKPDPTTGEVIMSRKVRKVPANWQHPKNSYDKYQPMYDNNYEDVAKEWLASCILWSKGEHPDQYDGCKYYWEYDGAPDEEYYRPKWKAEEQTHYMMYEDTSEGTPISPAFATVEELAQWLADTGASSFADATATYEQWLYTCNGGYAPSAVIENRVFKSGVEAFGN